MQNLLQQPKPSVIKAINQVLDAIKEAAPIPSAHKRSLPHDIRDLSVLLTEERGAMGRPYWAAKNLFSAYVHYFLPWNLYRLGWLIPSLPLQLQAGNSLVDLGSGPLTLPLALWCSKPEWRDMPLRFLCTDVANQPMEQGLAIFNTLTGNASPWTIECVKAPIETALIKLPGRVDCIMAGNVLNELQPAKGQTLQERIGDIVHSCSRRLNEGGTLFFVEPGTRLGGKVVIMAREAGRELGLPVVAPCTHQERCPLAKDMEREEFLSSGRPRGSYVASQSNMWCHFSFPVQGAPVRLSRLTAAAKFDRRNLALSCLMMRAEGIKEKGDDRPPLSDLEYLDDLEALYDETMRTDAPAGNFGPSGEGSQRTSKMSGVGKHRKPEWEKAKYFEGLEGVVDGTIVPPLWTRIMSGPIRLPKEPLPARYGCSEAGLVLVRRCERIPYGAAVEVTWEKLRRDEKSGALMVDMLLSEENRMDETAPWSNDAGGRDGLSRGRGEGDRRPHRRGVLPGQRQRREEASEQRKKGQAERGDSPRKTGQRVIGRLEGPRSSDKTSKSSRNTQVTGGQGSERSEGRYGSRRNTNKAGRQGDIQGGSPRDSQGQVSDFQSFFGRPQKMRERYGGFPQQPHGSPDMRDSRSARGSHDSHRPHKSSGSYGPQKSREGQGAGEVQEFRDSQDSRRSQHPRGASSSPHSRKGQGGTQDAQSSRSSRSSWGTPSTRGTQNAHNRQDMQGKNNPRNTAFTKGEGSRGRGVSKEDRAGHENNGFSDKDEPRGDE